MGFKHLVLQNGLTLTEAKILALSSKKLPVSDIAERLDISKTAASLQLAIAHKKCQGVETTNADFVSAKHLSEDELHRFLEIVFEEAA